MTLRLPRRIAARLGADDRGVAAVEFALVIPIVMLIYLTGFEVGEASTVYRKLTDTTVQMANVTAQYTTMSKGDVTNVMNATAQIMSPYSTSTLSGTISEVQVSSAGVATIAWSEPFQNGTPYQGTALAVGSAVTPPSGFSTPSTYFIMVNTAYVYSPTIGGAFVGNFNMSNVIYMLPRESTSIPYTG